jgi:hypothetical protein
MTGVNGIPFEKSMGFCNINNDLHAKFFRPAIMIASIVPLLGVAITVIFPNATASAKPFAVSFSTCFAVMSQLFPASRAYLDNVVSGCNKLSTSRRRRPMFRII